MKYRKLGRSGLGISPLCLGTMMFGDRTDEAEAGRIADAARDAGVNFIDTADVYSKGASEEIVGRLIRNARSHWILATKVGNPMGDAPNEKGLSRRWVLQGAEASLRRLGVDDIDIYYLHRDDPDTPLEETLSGIEELLRAGKVRYFGLSNYRGWRIASIVRLCDTMSIPRPLVCQPYYNAMDRTPEVEILPACAHFGLGVVPYSPLARGVLTGKYRPGAKPPEDSRAGRKDRRMMETEFREESLRIAQKISQHATSKGITPGQFAVAWVLNNRFVHSVLAGPRTSDQWRDYVAALDYRFTEEDEAFLNALVPRGHASTHGYSDPQYPIAGRESRASQAQ